ncbi:hypothetical protein M5689_011901 [Euphorbia peplus]|nr:hypothetical protein M5689_011901 [Euphorbia peplus]
MEEPEDEIKPNLPLLPFLQTLKKASKDLQHNSIFLPQNPLPAIEALLDLQTQKAPIFSSSPNLSLLLSRLKTLKPSNGYSLKAILRRQLVNYRIYQLAFEIEAEIQTLIDQEIIRIISNLREIEVEDEKLMGLREFEKRLLQGFDSEFQELILKSKGFPILESLIGDSGSSGELREEAAFCVVALVRFNRDVFVGLILMGTTVKTLISMASEGSIRALCSLIRLIRIPLIDELELIGEITKIINLCNSGERKIQVAAIDCICDIAYFARKEVIEAMVRENLIERLMELQRCENGEIEEMKTPFASCVRRFGVQIETGEGLSGRERREMKMEILRRVKEAAVSEAEAACIVAEVLWGSSSP